MGYKSLIINPGSTSTKIGVFEDENLLFEETLRHATEEIAKYDSIVAQKDFRKEVITKVLADNNFDIKTLDVVVGRGGLLKPIPGGTYEVTDALIKDLVEAKRGEHASNLGGLLAKEIADEVGVPAYIVDPVVVDELSDVARISGHPEMPRTSIFHALNQKAVAKRYAKEQGVPYYGIDSVDYVQRWLACGRFADVGLCAFGLRYCLWLSRPTPSGGSLDGTLHSYFQHYTRYLFPAGGS